MPISVPDVEALIRLLVNSQQLDHAALDAIASALPPGVRNYSAEIGSVGNRLVTLINFVNNDAVVRDGLSSIQIVLRQIRLVFQEQAIVAEADRLLLVLTQAPAAAVAGAPPVGIRDVIGAKHMWGGAVLFADRDKLRARLEHLGSPHAPPAVVVNGESQVGKSHTRLLLSHVALQTGAFVLAWYEIPKEQAAQFTPDWLAEELVRSVKLAPSPPPLKRTPLPRWHSDLANWVVSEVAQVAGTRDVWLLIDGLGIGEIKPEVREVVANLATRAGMPPAPGGPRLRLVLINCDPTLCRLAGCPTEVETFGHLTVDDARGCVLSVAPDRFDEIWTDLEPALLNLPDLTSPIVGAMVAEAIRG